MYTFILQEESEEEREKPPEDIQAGMMTPMEGYVYMCYINHTHS